MKNDKLKVGQEIYFEPMGNAARYNKDIIVAKIKSIGNKYFTVEETNYKIHPSARFFITDLVHDGGNYSPNYRGYLSLQEIQDKDEYPELFKEACKKLGTFTNKELKTFLNPL